MSMFNTTVWLAAQRTALVLCGLLFALVVPRLLGREFYGRFALIMSIVSWCAVLAEWGGMHVMSRYIPPLAARRDEDAIRRLLGNLLSFRMASGFATGLVSMLALRLLVSDVPGPVLMLAGLVPFFVSMSDCLFCFFLGIQRAPRWGAAILLRRGLMVVFVPLGFLAGGLAGAVAGIVVLEIAVLGTGMIWARAWIPRVGPCMEREVLLPLFSFASFFFAAMVVHAGYQYSGETLIHLVNGDYRQVSYYAVAHSMLLAMQGVFLQVLAAFGPFLTGLMADAGRAEVELWTRRLVKGLSIAVVPLAAGLSWFGPSVIPLLMGEVYRPAATTLSVMVWCMLLLVPAGVSSTLALVHERPRVAMGAALVRLLLFWSLGAWWISKWQSHGAAAAIVAANVGYAAWFAWRVKKWAFLPLGAWSACTAWALLVPFLQMAWPAGVASAAAYTAWLAAGGVAAIASGLVSRGDLMWMCRKVGWVPVARPDAPLE